MDKKHKKFRVSQFDIKQFSSMIDKVTQGHEFNQRNQKNTLLDNQNCIIFDHNNSQVESICINQQCHAINRKICPQCVIQGVHSNDQQKLGQQNQRWDADYLCKIIKCFRRFVVEQIDYLEYCFYLELLILIQEDSEKLFFIQIGELNKLDENLKLIKYAKEQIQIADYLQQQNSTNIGIFDYLSQFYRNIEEIQIKPRQSFHLRNKRIQYYFSFNKLINDQKVQAFYDFRKQKFKIIRKITQTLQFKNKEIDDKELKIIQQCSNEIYKSGQKLQEQGKYEKAIKCFQQYILVFPNNFEAFNNTGNCFYKLEKLNEAIQMQDKALILNPQYIDALIGKGQSLYKLNRYYDSIQTFDKAIALNPQQKDDILDAIIGKSRCLIYLKEYDLAINLQDLAIQINPNNSNYYFYKGISLRYLKQYERAIQMYDKAIEYNIQNFDAYVAKGSALDDLQRHEEAISVYDQVIQMSPQFIWAYKYKEKSLSILQRHEEARLVFEQIKKLQKER